MNSTHNGVDISTKTHTQDMVRHFIYPVRHKGDVVKAFQKYFLSVHAFDGIELEVRETL